MNIEQQLREVLRPEEPDAGFTARLQARLAAQTAAQAALVTARPRAPRRRWLVPAALAATLLIAFGIAQQLGQRNERQRELYAHAQLLQALAITSSRLDNVHRHLERDFLED